MTEQEAVESVAMGLHDARLSPDGRFLYVDESGIGKVGAFVVSGNLTELTTSPFVLSVGATPAGIVVS
jgi:6-phosphogluconolactonase (cycloisomerase 2 family)